MRSRVSRVDQRPPLTRAASESNRASRYNGLAMKYGSAIGARHWPQHTPAIGGPLKSLLRSALAVVIPAVLLASAHAQTPPTVRVQNGASQLIVNSKPFLLLGGELGNSSAGTAAQADTILPRLAGLHFNTVLMPVAWNQIEPQEGSFDFSILDHWIEVARRQHLHLVLLWFGSWKNAFSEYAPPWVLRDTRRFPREISAQGLPLAILSPFGEQTMQSDARAFTALLRHLRDENGTQHTVLMVQVENEIGYLGLGGRDRSPAANHLFNGPVPPQLSTALAALHADLPRKFAADFHPDAKTWTQMFGDRADEVFMAWSYARFVNQVAENGKHAYDLPMYMNAQLPAPFERAGEYPSGGPYPLMQAIYRVAAPSINFYAPDIYWPDFAHWVNEYQAAGNPVFIPEARLDQAPLNALYALGEARGFGFSPFAVDSLPAAASHAPPLLSAEYQALSQLSNTILNAQANGKIRALVLHASSPRPSRTIALDGFLFHATLARGWPAKQLLADDGAMMVIQSAPDEFYILGSGLTVHFLRNPDVDGQIAGISSIDELENVNGQWITKRRLNGDQSDQGRALLMSPHQFGVYRVKLYTFSR